MTVPRRRVALVALAGLAWAPAHAAEPPMSACEQALRALKTEAFIGVRAGCPGQREAFCRRLGEPESFALLTDRWQSDRVATQAALAACALDYDGLHAHLCSQGYNHEDLVFVYRHCPDEAWSLARAQCERNTGSESPRYAEFCRDFKSGRAPTLGR